MSNFTITRVSDKEPRTWSFNDRRTNQNIPMVTYRVMLEGEHEPVEVNKKPGEKPAVGDVLTGTVEESQYGKRFKPERKPFAPSTKDSGEIKAEWAIGQAIHWLKSDLKDADLTDIEALAKDLFVMVERVKLGEPSGKAKAAAVIDAIAAKRKEAESTERPHISPPPAMRMEAAGDINLDDIPF